MLSWYKYMTVLIKHRKNTLKKHYRKSCTIWIYLIFFPLIIFILNALLLLLLSAAFSANPTVLELPNLLSIYIRNYDCRLTAPVSLRPNANLKTKGNTVNTTSKD